MDTVHGVCTSDKVAREPEVRPAPVRVLVPLVQTSEASVPKPVRVREPAAQTLAGIEEIEEAIPAIELPRDEEAVVTTVFVFVLITAASEEDAVSTVASVLLFTLAVPAEIAEAREEVAVSTSDRVAREPDVRPAPVRVLVADPQTSEARLPKPVRVLVPAAHTLAGIEAICAANELEALSTAVLVFALIIAASDVDAVSTVASVLLVTSAVPAVMAEPSDEVAVSTSDNVASEPLLSPAPVRVRVPFVHTSAASVPKPVRVREPAAQTLAGIDAMELAIEESEEPSEEDAASTVLFVLALMTEAREVDAVRTVASVLLFTLAVPAEIADPSEEVAVWTSDRVARLPEVRPAPVRVLVPLVQTSEASVPKPVRVREPAAQTLAGIDEIELVMDESVLPKDDEAAKTVALVLLLTAAVPAVMAEPSDEVAVSTSDKVAREPDVRPAPVRVLVADPQTSEASVPNPVRVLVPAAQTLAGMDEIEEAIEAMELPRDEEAVVTIVFVFVLITAASEEEAVSTAASVLLFTLAVPAEIAEAREEVAVSTSDRVAREPDVRPAPVSVRVPLVQTSAASVPNPVSVRVPAAQTLTGIEVIDEAIEAMELPSEEDAASTVLFVLAFITAAKDDDAVRTVASVLPLTAETMPAVALLVLALTTAATEELAVSTSDKVASEPDERVEAVSVRVAAFHMSDAIAVPEVSVRVPAAHMSLTKVPNDESVRVEKVHMEPGSVAASDDDACNTAASVFGFTAAATAVLMSAAVGADEVAMPKVRSPLIRVPSSADPQLMDAGYVPCVDVEYV